MTALTHHVDAATVTLEDLATLEGTTLVWRGRTGLIGALFSPLEGEMPPDLLALTAAEHMVDLLEYQRDHRYDVWTHAPMVSAALPRSSIDWRPTRQPSRSCGSAAGWSSTGPGCGMCRRWRSGPDERGEHDPDRPHHDRRRGCTARRRRRVQEGPPGAGRDDRRRRPRARPARRRGSIRAVPAPRPPVARRSGSR